MSDESKEFDKFMDAYEEKEKEILAERIKMYKEYANIRDLDGRQEYLQLDLNRYKLYYLGWTLAGVAVILFSTKLFKSSNT